MEPIESGLRLQNDSIRDCTRKHWWKWSVWVAGSSEVMSQISTVTYRLHSTFANPVREVRDATTQFKLRSGGWGEFVIRADVRLKDERVVRLERWLKLDGLERAERRPVVFISHSVADAGLVCALKDALKQQDVDVRTPEDSVEADAPVVETVTDILRAADMTVAVISAPPAASVEREALAAQSMGREVLPVLVGDAQVPRSLSTLLRCQVKDGQEASILPLADRIAARAKDLVIPEESP